VIKPELREQFEKEMRLLHLNKPESTDPNDEQDELREYKTGRWTEDEHKLFLEALMIYGKDWDKIEAHVKTRDAAHIRSHA